MNFTLRQISEITSIPIRRVRHILDQEIIAHRRWYSDDEGWASRRLNLDGAILAAAASHLVSVGFGRSRVREIIASAEAIQPKYLKKNPLNHSWLDVVLFEDRETSVIEIGDGNHLRMTAGTRDSGWYQLTSDSPILEKDYSPIVTTVIDMFRIRQLFTSTPGIANPATP